MRRVLLGGVLVLLLALLALEALAVASPVRAAPFRLHDWWLAPVACAEVRCVSYREWARTVRAAGPGTGAEELLTQLLTSRSVRLIARRSGLDVTDSEVDASLRAITETAVGQPQLEKFIRSQYEGVSRDDFRFGMRDLLQYQKLTAAGMTNVWEHPTAPRVRILHARYRWDDQTHRVVHTQ